MYYYITVMNENYEHPAIPQGEHVAADIIKGMYAFKKADADKKAPRVQLLGAGTIFNEVIAAADLLKNDWGVAADLWSVPSFTGSRVKATRSNAGTCSIRPKSVVCRTCRSA